MSGPPSGPMPMRSDAGTGPPELQEQDPSVGLHRTGSNSQISPTSTSSSSALVSDSVTAKSTNSTVGDSNVSRAEAVDGDVGHSLAKVTSGRKNYRVVESPSIGGGVTSASGGQDVEVKAVSVAPILATRVVEEVTPPGNSHPIPPLSESQIAGDSFNTRDGGD